MFRLKPEFDAACAATEIKSPSIQLGASMGAGFAMTPVV
jgi:hypothetical protein